jgi:long-chain fatty acid transport protein
MRKMRLARTITGAAALALALLPAPSLGAGYGIYEQSAAVLGMGGAGTASVHDASAVFFNPAAMIRLEGSQLYAGGTVLSPVTSFAGVGPYPGFGVKEEMKEQRFYPPTFYFTHRYRSAWALGLGFNSPFGLGVEWVNPDTFTGRYIVTKADLRTLDASVSAAYQMKPNLSLGFGGNLVYTSVALQNRRFLPAPGGGGSQFEVASIALDSDYSPGYGWNAGLSWVPLKSLRLGATYRSKVIVYVDGQADFTQKPTGNPVVDAGVAAQLPPDQAVTAVVRLPAIWAAGVAWGLGGSFTLEADATYTEWSLFKDLPIYFAQTPASNETIVEDYENSLQLRFGLEHRLSVFTYRLGYYHDEAAAPTQSVSPILPDAARDGGTFGLGFGFGRDRRWALDLYELALTVKNRNTDGINRDGFNGEYKSFVNASGLSLAYRW